MKNKLQKYLLLTLVYSFLSIQPIFCIDFVFNTFNSSTVSLYGNATIESSILTLTDERTFSIGRALYPFKISTKQLNSSYVLPFSTSFIFAMAPYKDIQPGHGIVFLFVPYTGIDGTTSSQNLGFLNRTNDGDPNTHVFGVEFDVFQNEEFQDIDDNHVGIDINSLTSTYVHEAGFWNHDDEESFQELTLNDGKNYQVWIDYADSWMNVSMVEAGMIRPKRPLISVSVNLSQVFEDEMYVGFTAATGALVQSHKILAWSFSNENFNLSDALITSNLPSFQLPEDPIYKSEWFVVGLSVGLFVVVVTGIVGSVLLIKRNRRLRNEREDMEDWELEYWPHKIPYHEIEIATKNFADENVIGVGGNGPVYKGVLPGGVEVAIKRITQENGEGMREFLSEISSLGRLKHRNLVGLRGWCKKERGSSLIVVYDYMENGSLDKRVFSDCDEKIMLNCEERIRILKDIASALLYLHEGWESKVLHRDIKSSNVLLDKYMNAKLGDFGLARMHEHDVMAATTRVVGTVGYMAPEVVRTGRASMQTDVFGYGVLILEVMCGRRPIEEGKPHLIAFVLEHMKQEKLLNAIDERIRAHKGDFDEEEVEKVVQVGLLCSHPEASSRPTMRIVVKLFEGKNDNEESEVSEDLSKYLLGKMNFGELWVNSSLAFGNQSYPTFEQILKGWTLPSEDDTTMTTDGYSRHSSIRYLG
ncbi:hypothetical protein LIER_35715 [Lithospermum erythrorhizon]|uniref:non-specific serine/threonine protein kinase n=1 Tax=Lithospermum erythrorhizon TaxID=34254 RepID=A0AAV3NVE3_LITER